MLKTLKSKFVALSRGGKVAVIVAGLIGFGTVASMNKNSTVETVDVKPQAQLEKPETIETIEPVTTKETVTETSDVPFEKVTIEDANLAAGTVQLRTAGVVGKKTFTYEITKVDGAETDKKLVSEEVTTQPISEVTAKGTKVAAAPKPVANANCSPHYSGCVPIASDVDCAGGSGNGPAYVRGPINVIGVDIYDLDRDGNGIACE